MYSISTQPDPLHINKTTLLYLFGDPASLLLVTNTHLPLSLVCQKLPHPLLCPSHPFTPHSSNNIIYIDDINNSRSSSSGTITTLVINALDIQLVGHHDFSSYENKLYNNAEVIR